MTVVVEVGPGPGYRMSVGGLSVLERALRALGQEGVRQALVRAEPIGLPNDLGLEVIWLPSSGEHPAGVPTRRGDVVSGQVVEDEASRRAVERNLLRSLARSRPGLIDNTFNWRFSHRLTGWLASTPVTPNQVTVFSIALGLLASLVVLSDIRAALAVGGVLLQLQSIVDCCDGELARLRFQGSRLGQWLDNLGDDLVDIVFPLAVGVHCGWPWSALALVAASGRGWALYKLYREVYRLTGSGDVYAFRAWFESESPAAPEPAPPSWFSQVRNLGRRDTYVFLWMLLGLLGLGQQIVIYFAIVSAVTFAIMLLHQFFRRV